MSYNAYVTTLKNVRPHPNADRLKLAECFDNTVCVGLDAAEGEIGLYFPVDGQLSEEYCKQNNLTRNLDENGKNIGGYLDPVKRNVTAIRLRGSKSDGLFMPLQSIVYTGINLADLDVGFAFTTLNGHEICQKYISCRKEVRMSTPSNGNHVRKKKTPIAPLFAEHADTEQLAYNLAAFKKGDQIEITLKMHGTSQRTGYLPILKGFADTYKCKAGNSFRRILAKLNHTSFEERHDGKPIYDWGYVTGTRRTVLNNFDGGYYGSNAFREQHAKVFEGKLWKGEEVYYEVVGFTDTGAPIMGDCSNSKLNDKEFVKKYGKTTTFSYGCEPSHSDLYVYRMTMTNEDGEVVEYTPDFMRYRCEQMGVKTVPVFWKGFVDETIDLSGAGEWVKNLAEQYYDGADPIGKTHVREGVVVRIVNKPKFCAYKHKNFSFKCLSGIAIAQAETSGKIDNMSEDILSEM